MRDLRLACATWHALVRYRIVRLYDEAMIRWWPYDRWPGEWKDLLDGPSGQKETGTDGTDDAGEDA